MTSLAQRQVLMSLIDEAVICGARAARAYQIAALSGRLNAVTYEERS